MYFRYTTKTSQAAKWHPHSSSILFLQQKSLISFKCFDSLLYNFKLAQTKMNQHMQERLDGSAKYHRNNCQGRDASICKNDRAYRILIFKVPFPPFTQPLAYPLLQFFLKLSNVFENSRKGFLSPSYSSAEFSFIVLGSSVLVSENSNQCRASINNSFCVC